MEYPSSISSHGSDTLSGSSETRLTIGFSDPVAGSAAATGAVTAGGGEERPRSRWRIPVWRGHQSQGRELSKQGVVRDMIVLSGSTAIISLLVIAVLYILVFVVHPSTARSMASHNFISENPILKDGMPIDGLNRWLEDFSRSVIPIMCHSHNDYWRPYPLFSALAAGCTGVEADVWLSEDGKDLLVGHDPTELSPDRTLKTMYLEPLLNILETENPNKTWANNTVHDRARGVFKSQPNTTLVLMIDVKTDITKTWPVVLEQLEQLRGKRFLTRFEHVYIELDRIERQMMWPAPIIVVGSGNLDRETHYHSENRKGDSYNEYHDTFIDAPLQSLPVENDFGPDEKGPPESHLWPIIRWDKMDAYYASTSFKESIGSARMGFSKRQISILRSQIRATKRSGLKSRYWDVPSWPIGYRDYVWNVLTREGVDMLSVDDLESAARRSWSAGYVKSVAWVCLVSIWIICSSLTCVWLTYRFIKKWEMQRQRIVLE